MMRKSFLLLFFSLLPALVLGQSLAEIAKNEKERRRNNRKHGVEVRVVSEDEISTAPPGDSGPHEETSADATGSSLSEADEESRTAPAGISDRERKEAEWRSRLSEARARLESARERFEQLDRLYLSPGQRYVDGKGQSVIASLSQLRRLVAEAKAELEDASLAMDRLKEEAREAGIPPGWLR